MLLLSFLRKLKVILYSNSSQIQIQIYICFLKLKWMNWCEGGFLKMFLGPINVRASQKDIQLKVKEEYNSYRVCFLLYLYILPFAFTTLTICFLFTLFCKHLAFFYCYSLLSRLSCPALKNFKLTSTSSTWYLLPLYNQGWGWGCGFNTNLLRLWDVITNNKKWVPNASFWWME